jgi:hypothetical protein
MKLTSDSLIKIAPAIVKAQAEMGNAVKDSKNPFFKSKYADLNSVREAVLPAFNKHGISVLQPTIFCDGKKFVQTILIHESGEYFSGVTEILSVKETDAQAQGSGISYARRYGLQALANIGADDDDGNSASGKTESGIRQTASGNGNVQTVSVTTTPLEKAGVLAEGARNAAIVASTSTTKAPAGSSFRKNKANTNDL